jgi:hypothetical protein
LALLLPFLDTGKYLKYSISGRPNAWCWCSLVSGVPLVL